MNQLETDYIKWYAFSPCANHTENTRKLINVLVSMQSKQGIAIVKEQENEETEYKLSIDYYPSTLLVNDISVQQMISYLDSIYPSQLTDLKSNTNETSKEEGMVREEILSKPSTLETNQTKSTFGLLKKLSSKNKFIHSLPYSLVGLSILQVVILPGNIGKGKVGDWGYYYFLITLSGLATLNVWSYSKIFYKIRSYQHIFQLTASYVFLSFSFILLEVFLIDAFNSGISFFANSILFILVHCVGLMISVIITAAIYYIKGGKMITFKNR